VTAYVRMDDRKIRIKSGIYEPDFVIVLDPTLVSVVNISEGLKSGASILVNTPSPPEMFRSQLGLTEDKKVSTVDATAVAIAHRLGSKTAPIVNSAILGAFVRVSELVKIESLVKAVKKNVPIKHEENEAAARDAFKQVVMA
jgi:2-oxoacid:acceptor oxidoreductase gamma subunit (pyruvate/2-ketoisovalerate family)